MDRDWSVIAGLATLLVFAGRLSAALGLTSTTPVEFGQPDINEPGGNFVTNTINVVGWVFESIGSVIQLMTFNIDAPEEIAMFIVVPIWAAVLMIVLKLVRG